MLDEEAAAKFSTAAALAAKEKRKEMAKANYDKGLLAAVDVDKFREVGHLTFDEKMVFAACLQVLSVRNQSYGLVHKQKGLVRHAAGQRSANLDGLCKKCHWSSSGEWAKHLRILLQRGMLEFLPSFHERIAYFRFQKVLASLCYLTDLKGAVRWQMPTKFHEV